MQNVLLAGNRLRAAFDLLSLLICRGAGDNLDLVKKDRWGVTMVSDVVES